MPAVGKSSARAGKAGSGCAKLPCMLISVLAALAVAAYFAATVLVAQPALGSRVLPRPLGLGVAAVAVLAHGASGFVTKPLDPDALVDAVEGQVAA